jgi:hypothetical protein
MRTRLLAALALGVALLAPASLPAQSSAFTSHWMFEDSPALGEPLPDPSQDSGQAAANPAAGLRITVQGVVLNAATGQPLPRVLVKVEDTGALTDGEGRFEIPGVPAGLQTITATKPGFRGQGSSYRGFDSNAYHLVRVADKMPELSFSLAPTNTLSGHVTLSTGDPAVGIGIQLLRQSVEDGRANWNLMDVHPTNPEGEYRFAGLEDGTYLAMTLPAFDNDLTACTAPVARLPHRLFCGRGRCRRRQPHSTRRRPAGHGQLHPRAQPFSRYRHYRSQAPRREPLAIHVLTPGPLRTKAELPAALRRKKLDLPRLSSRRLLHADRGGKQS